MTCHALPCAGQMARLRGMITQIALGSLAAVAIAAPRPARVRPAGVSDRATAAVAMPDAPAGTSAGEPPSLPVPGSQARPKDDGLLAGPLPEEGGRTARHHDERWCPPPPVSAGGYGARHTVGGVQAPALQSGLRRPHPPAPSPLLSPHERGSAASDRPGSEAAFSSPSRERAIQMSVLPRAESVTGRHPASARAAEMPPLISASQRGPTGALSAPGQVHNRRARPAAATVTQHDAAWQWAYGLRAADDAAMHPTHTPPPLSDTALRGPAGRLHDDTPPAAPDADARERQMRLDAAR
jgi:hypothetical protein